MRNILLFPLRLLVFLVRVPVALLDILVYLLYALILYVIAIPGFLLNGVFQLLMYPLRRARGVATGGGFRAGWFLTGPVKMYLSKQREILAWLWASWRVLRSRKQREASRERQIGHYQAYFRREEPVLTEQPSPRRRQPGFSGNREGIPDIPVFGKTRAGAGNQQDSGWDSDPAASIRTHRGDQES